jgi:hypothetical protein
MYSVVCSDLVGHSRLPKIQLKVMEYKFKILVDTLDRPLNCCCWHFSESDEKSSQKQRQK